MSFMKYPLLDNWDNLEIHPVRYDIDQDVHYIVDWEEATKHDQWVVYVHLVGGGMDEICNFYSKEDAFKFANKIINLINKFERTEFTDLTTFKL